MLADKKKAITIGLVLSTVPKYSETFFRNKIKGLQKNGFKVVLFVDYKNENDEDYGYKVVSGYNFNQGKLLTIWYSLLVIIKSLFVHPAKSLRFFNQNSKDGIPFFKNIRQVIINQFFFTEHVDWLHFGFGMLAVQRENVATAMKAKMAVSFRGFDLYLSPLKHPGCYNILFKKDVKYHVLSQEMKSDLMQENINSDNIEVITPAIDTDFFQIHREPEAKKETRLVTVARLHWKKGLEYTLQALAILKEKGLDFHYTIIGDGEEKERLVYTAHQLGIIDNITFAGKLTQEALREEVLNNSIYLQYSIQEGFCNSVLEAQALGLMCIVSNAEGLSENVLNEKTGWVVTKRKPKLLAEKILYVIDLSDEIKRSIKQNAIDRVKIGFNLQKQQQEFVDFYSN